MGGFAYQAAYAVARLASLLTRYAVLDMDDIPMALRFDWAEDIDEVIDGGGVVFTQCKKVLDAGRPGFVAQVMVGLAPKLLWAGTEGAIAFRLVSPDPRFGRVAVRAHARPTAERDAAKTAFVRQLESDPPPGTDRALWRNDADRYGIEALFDAIWERLEFVYA